MATAELASFERLVRMIRRQQAFLHDAQRTPGTLAFINEEGLPMADPSPSNTSDDPYDLNRFVDAQAHDYDQALSEIKSGRKRSHWMWYIFPQFEGLGFSPTSRRYSIKSLGEAEAYLSHAVLGPRLTECSEAVLHVEGRSAHDIFGSPDDMKLKSCATLFASASHEGSVFERLLEKYFQGERDEKTLRLLGG